MKSLPIGKTFYVLAEADEPFDLKKRTKVRFY